MKTLIIAPKYPSPASDGSSIRTMNFVRYFGGLGEVDILFKSDGDGTRVKNCHDFSKEYRVDVSKNGAYRPGRIERVIDKLIRLKSWMNSDYTPENESEIRRIVTGGDYDFILCRYLGQAYPLLSLDKAIWRKVILDVDDIIADSVYAADTAHITGIGNLSKMLDKHIYQRYQKKCMGLGSILFCSDTDRSQAIRPAFSDRAYVVPNVYQETVLSAAYRRDGYDNINQLLFVGSLTYTPNFQGVAWFVKEIFPRLLGLFNDLEFSIVGKNPPDELSDLVKRYPQIHLHANVPDITSFYERCGVVVVPLLAGGGTRIKILESGFMHRPVLSTEIGAYGLQLMDGKNVMLFKNTETFIDKYQKIRDDRSSYAAMTENLLAHVSDRFSFGRFSDAMDAVVIKS